MAAADTVRTYFDALRVRDLDAAGAVWARDGVDRLAGVAELHGPEGVRRYFGELFAAFPDFELVARRYVAQGDTVAVRWTATGTFAGAPYMGFEPNGARVAFEGADVLEVRDGLIVRNDAVADGMTLARQLGALPPAGSRQEERLAQLFNARTRALQTLFHKEAERIADGVWLVRGDLRGAINVYLLEEPGGGVTVFDAGTRSMTNGIAAAGARLGGIRRVVLGHAHVDHRGAAPGLGAPVFCHPAEVADAEGDGGVHYQDLDELPLRARHLYKHVLFPRWDGGPVAVAGTVEEGDEVCGFEVVHCPGHAPGLIALHRGADGLVLCSDVVYLVDSIKLRELEEPVVPGRWWNFDHEQARASVRKLAAREPRTVWTGHTPHPLDRDVRGRLEAAADRG